MPKKLYAWMDNHPFLSLSTFSSLLVFKLREKSQKQVKKSLFATILKHVLRLQSHLGRIKFLKPSHGSFQNFRFFWKLDRKLQFTILLFFKFDFWKASKIGLQDGTTLIAECAMLIAKCVTLIPTAVLFSSFSSDLGFMM